jgi:hypothetical protein
MMDEGHIQVIELPERVEAMKREFNRNHTNVPEGMLGFTISAHQYVCIPL